VVHKDWMGDFVDQLVCSDLRAKGRRLNVGFDRGVRLSARKRESLGRLRESWKSQLRTQKACANSVEGSRSRLSRDR
jgi:hypothetical protein